MLSPTELLIIADTMIPLLDQLNLWILEDLIKRLFALMNRKEDLFLNPTSNMQMEVYREAAGHYQTAERYVKAFTAKSDAEVKEIFEDAGIKAWKSDNDFYMSRGEKAKKLTESEGTMRILTDAYQRTNGDVHNLTRTTADASQKRFIEVVDDAYMKASTGAESYTAACEEAVDELINQQSEVVYPSGATDTVETAVLRCVRTGTAQASGNLALQGMIDHDWDIVLVSAHLGARYGDGGENPGNHFWWQGKFYSLNGKTPGLLPFKETTGYGTGEGLSGWNCRHSFGPGDGEHNPYDHFDKDENKKAYDLSQQQRKMEAAIRKGNREYFGIQTAVREAKDPALKKKFMEHQDRLADKLRKMNQQYADFCTKNDLMQFPERLYTARDTRTKAIAAEQNNG